MASCLVLFHSRATNIPIQYWEKHILVGKGKNGFIHKIFVFYFYEFFENVIIASKSHEPYLKIPHTGDTNSFDRCG